jgi:hypothetical protein
MYGAHQRNLLQGSLRSVTKRRVWRRLRDYQDSSPVSPLQGDCWGALAAWLQQTLYHIPPDMAVHSISALQQCQENSN